MFYDDIILKDSIAINSSRAIATRPFLLMLKLLAVGDGRIVWTAT